jgi:hypothetical protein
MLVDVNRGRRGVYHNISWLPFDGHQFLPLVVQHEQTVPNHDDNNNNSNSNNSNNFKLNWFAAGELCLPRHRVSLLLPCNLLDPSIPPSWSFSASSVDFGFPP